MPKVSIKPSNKLIHLVRSALLKAREDGITYIINDKTTFATDDQDCYPRGIKITMDRKREEWLCLKALEREFEWFKIDRRSGSLSINPNQLIQYRLTELGFQEAVVNSLNESGIDCYSDVSWRG